MSRFRPDPAMVYNFSVSLVQSASPGATMEVAFGLPAQGGFSECAGLEVSIPAESYAEGGNNGALLKFPGRAAWSNIKLRRGVVKKADLWLWHLEFLEGRGKRRDGVITLHDQNGETVRSWRFRRGIPVRWSGPALNAMQSMVAVEEIEIAHEGVSVSGAGSVVAAVGEAVSAVGSLF